MGDSGFDPWRRVKFYQEPTPNYESQTSWNSFPRATAIFLAINIGVYIILEWLGSTLDSQFMFEHGALQAIVVWQEGEYWRTLTAAFLHFGASHLMNNMMMLAILGSRLEKTLDSVRFIIIYLVSAIGANIMSVVWYLNTEPRTLSAGASGATMGIAGGLFGVILRRRHSEQGISRREMTILIVVSLYSGYVAQGTNNIAHISGVLIGFLLGFVLG